MGKTEKNNHSKVPKITEEEYTAYVNHLRELSETEQPRVGVENCSEEAENQVE